MKKFLLVTASFLAISSAASADSADSRFPNWYLGLSGGAAGQTSSDFKGTTNGSLKWQTGYSAEAALGYAPAALGGFRVEAEVSQHKQDIKSAAGNAKVNAAAGNLYYDFVNSSTLTPYVGGGVGIGKFHFDGANGSGAQGDDTKAIYQGMVGVAYEPKSLPDVAFTLGYRYFAPFSKPEVGGNAREKIDYDNHSVEAGARFRF